MKPRLVNRKNSHCPPPSSAGTLITLTLLSALPEISRLEVGLKRSVVGGNSWAFRIVKRGCSVSISLKMDPAETRSNSAH